MYHIFGDQNDSLPVDICFGNLTKWQCKAKVCQHAWWSKILKEGKRTIKGRERLEIAPSFFLFEACRWWCIRIWRSQHKGYHYHLTMFGKSFFLSTCLARQLACLCFEHLFFLFSQLLLWIYHLKKGQVPIMFGFYPATVSLQSF
jgi:hypothetical protein